MEYKQVLSFVNHNLNCSLLHVRFFDLIINYRFYLHGIPQNKSLTKSLSKPDTYGDDDDDDDDGTKISSLKKQQKHEDMTQSNDNYYDGERISLTFRTIATYLQHDGILEGQGAPSLPIPSLSTSSLTSDKNKVDANRDSYNESLDTLNLWPKDIIVHIPPPEEHEHDDDSSDGSDPNSRQKLARTQIIRYNNRNLTMDQVLSEKSSLYHAFRTENLTAGFVWDDVYTRGFSVW